MVEPLGATAGIAGLTSFGIQVMLGLIRFYTSYKDRNVDLARTVTKLESLLKTLQSLQNELRKRQFRSDEQDLIKNIQNLVYDCREFIEELNEECKKFEKDFTAPSMKSNVKVISRRIAYPFRQSTLLKLDEAISGVRSNLSSALEVLQLRDHTNNQNDIAEIKSLLEMMNANQCSSEIRGFLKAPDVTINHNAACAKRHSGTGNWFVKSSVFATWLNQENSFLWLSGFAGCGKSILCSTAIQHSFRQTHNRTNERVGIAFFYFTFNDDSKQDESVMLRALLLHLSGQLSDFEADLAQLYDSDCTSSGVPPSNVLIAYLQRLTQKFDQVYILLDALDESPRYGARDRVLNAIQTMRNWLLPGLHLLVTSRDEYDIRESLNFAEDHEVKMKNSEIDQDINNYISMELKTDPKLKKLHAYHDRI